MWVEPEIRDKVTGYICEMVEKTEIPEIPVKKLLPLFNDSKVKYYNYLFRKNSKNSLWMDNQVNYHNINLVIIYDDLFSSIPPNWIKIGELVLRGPKITVGGRTVSFYATKEENIEGLIKKLKIFKESLPYDNFKITIP